MRRILMTVVFIVISLTFINAQETFTKEEFKTSNDSASYALGYDIGNSLMTNGVDVNYKAFLQGMKDARVDDVQLLSDEEIGTVLQNLQAAMQQYQDNKSEELAMKNKLAGDAFLEENKTKEGVQVTESGLQYKIIEEGTGKQPASTDTVVVHYEGKLIDGTTFDSSFERNQPAEFPLNTVIPGWTEGLQYLKEGGKMELYIPSDLGYGPKGMGPIEPNSVLIFSVELIEVK